MKLTHIKIAGFKSFSDPIHIPVPSKLVGIVGPNGCGKSNVIDAARWVLGEMSAKQLRGSSMQDVIFNGSGERKAGSRASVELIFDNSLGKAGGLWAKYGEISVKRIIDRSGESSYFLNNQHVRRRDVADMFLGTGLGGRGYAIIEQGMISRIIEAKPEELRGFLEEAAGTSKYRERRRETELRLRDTRDNLHRVEDIREELSKQVSHLGNQAKMAAKYNDIQGQIRLFRGELAKWKQTEASISKKKYQDQVNSINLELEKINSELTGIHNEVESKKEEHESATKVVDLQQKNLYEVNANISKIEQKIEFLKETQEKTEERLTEIRIENQSQVNLKQDALTNLAQQEEELQRVALLEAESKSVLDKHKSQLPIMEEELRSARTQQEGHNQKSSSARQALELVKTKKEHSEQVQSRLINRLNRLELEKNDLVLPDTSGLVRIDSELKQCESEVSEQMNALAEAEKSLPINSNKLSAVGESFEANQKQLNDINARIEALQHIQSRAKGAKELKLWMERYSIPAVSYLWEEISIKDGWENALEAVLRERINSVEVSDLSKIISLLKDAPPTKISFHTASQIPIFEEKSHNQALDPLIDYVNCSSTEILSVLKDWLSGVYVLLDPSKGLECKGLLGQGELLVTREGHIINSAGISFHAPDSELHGVLGRQKEIEGLEKSRVSIHGKGADLAVEMEGVRAKVNENNELIKSVRKKLSSLQDKSHSIKLKHVRLTELAERVSTRGGQIIKEMTEIEEDKTKEEEKILKSQEAAEDLLQVVSDLNGLEVGIKNRCDKAEEDLKSHQELCELSQMKYQQSEYELRTLKEKIHGINQSLNLINENILRLNDQEKTLADELIGEDRDHLQDRLTEFLETQASKEESLRLARNDFDELEARLRDLDKRRLGLDFEKSPLQEKISDYRLKEQESSLAEKGYADQINELGFSDEEMASINSSESSNEEALELNIQKLSKQIERMGAVNLAAVDELQVAADRKEYLDKQSADLTDAVNTLDNAIKKIDVETRQQLQQTFDEVNGNFGKMFPALFGGGEATLSLTDSHILTAGIQVMARPPGKKNTSIQSLSGGEKALTALALVFSLFQLNPAPFCLLDEVDAPLDDSNTSRFCEVVTKMSEVTQFVFVTHNKITMEMAHQLIGVTMHELGVSKIVSVDIEQALKMNEEAAA